MNNDYKKVNHVSRFAKQNGFIPPCIMCDAINMAFDADETNGATTMVYAEIDRKDQFHMTFAAGIMKPYPSIKAQNN